MATKKRFPKKELNSWLKQHKFWDHEDWLHLIDQLSTQGFEDWTSSDEGRNAIGLYLETNRKAS